MELVAAAERIDGYRKACQASPLNWMARRALPYEPFFQGSQPVVQKGPQGSLICTLHPAAEGGLPHTRPPNLICIPAYYPESALPTLLRHELVHLDQRRRPGVWREAFLRDGWTPVSTTDIPPSYLDRLRLNPDTLDDGLWAWKNTYVPLPLFERTDRPDLRETQIRWWNQKTGSLLASPPISLEALYGSSHPQAEHPREILAVNLAEKSGPLEKLIETYLQTK